MSRELEERIAAIAVRQHGVVTRAQLLEAGASASAVGRRLRSRRLLQLHGGVYQAGPVAGRLAREMAAVLAGGREAFVSHISARGVWAPDASSRRSPLPAEVHVTVIGTGRHCRPGIHFHRVARLAPDERATCDGVPITTPARTLIDLTSMAGTREVEAAFAWMTREGLTGEAELRRLLRRHRGRPGTGMLRAILAAGAEPALTRSEAEERFLELIRGAGLPLPECNVRIGIYEIDFLWRKRAIAVEVDGYRHHSSRPRFEGDRRKDAWLLTRGITVIRLSWRQITAQPARMAALLAVALDRAGR